MMDSRHPYAKRAYQIQRGAKKHGVESTLRGDDIEYLFNVQPQCQHCGASDSLTIDHIVPMSKGGPNVVGNCQILCYNCNQEKRDHEQR